MAGRLSPHRKRHKICDRADERPPFRRGKQGGRGGQSIVQPCSLCAASTSSSPSQARLNCWPRSRKVPAAQSAISSSSSSAEMIPSSKSGNCCAAPTRDSTHSGSSLGFPHRLRQKGPSLHHQVVTRITSTPTCSSPSTRRAAARRYGSSRASVGGSGHSRLNTPSFLLSRSRPGRSRDQNA